MLETSGGRSSIVCILYALDCVFERGVDKVCRECEGDKDESTKGCHPASGLASRNWDRLCRIRGLCASNVTLMKTCLAMALYKAGDVCNRHNERSDKVNQMRDIRKMDELVDAAAASSACCGARVLHNRP